MDYSESAGTLASKRKPLMAHMGESAKMQRDRRVRERVAADLSIRGIATVVHFAKAEWFEDKVKRVGKSTLIVSEKFLECDNPTGCILLMLGMTDKHKVSQRRKTASVT